MLFAILSINSLQWLLFMIQYIPPMVITEALPVFIDISSSSVCITPSRQDTFTNGSEEEKEALNSKEGVIDIYIVNNGESEATITLSFVERVASSDEPPIYTNQTAVIEPIKTCPAKQSIFLGTYDLPDNTWAVIQTSNATQFVNARVIYKLKTPMSIEDDEEVSEDTEEVSPGA